LNGDNWGRYFEAVYGEVPDSGYPICLQDFWVVYEQALQNSGAQVPMAASHCPPDGSKNSRGALYGRSQGYLFPGQIVSPGTKSIFQPPPFTGLQDNTWIEVTHQGSPYLVENYGAWFFLAKGSGIWYNIGKTVAFQDHDDAFKHYGVTYPILPMAANEEMSRNCAAAGDNTIQFLNHKDGGTCGDCCDSLGGGWTSAVAWNYEIVACALNGATGCSVASGVKAGWMGKRNCECDESLGSALNCNGVPYR